ncbi:MAG: hypothetical protein QOF48_4056 [Verrucomicrobiota bacterium]|jgi:uncharacterized protein (DUF58 family)
MNRLRYKLYRQFSGLRHAIPRRFTPAGLLALVTLCATGAIGIDMDQTVGFQGFALVACLLMMAIMLAPFFRGRFTIERVLPRYGSVGEPFTYHVTVRNLGTRTWRDLELIEDVEDPRPSFADYAVARREAPRGATFRITRTPAGPGRHRRVAPFKPARVSTLAPHGDAEALVQLIPARRGPLRLIGATVARSDPFGLFRGFVRVPQTATVLILPKRYRLPSIALPGTRQYQRGGVTHASAIGQSDEFVSLRDYRPGDPLRHIHWRSWARTGRPIVKEFQDEFFVRHALILDTFASPAQMAAFEEAVAVASSFACSLSTQESLLDLMFVGPQAVCFTTGRGVGHAEQALEILASVRPCREKPFRSLQELVGQHAGNVCGCVCLLLGWDEPRRELIRQLESLGQPLLVLVIAEAAAAAAIRNAPAEGKPAQFHVLETGRIAEGLLQLEGARP